MDNWRYSELVIHPAPLNFFTFFLLPFIIKNSIMKSAAGVFSKFIFWIENSFFIFMFVLYEFMLCPLLLFRVLYNIIILSNIFTLLPLIIFWLIIGPLYLMGSIFIDTFYLIKIFCDY